MLWSLMRPFAFVWNQQAALEDVSTQTESGRDQTITFELQSSDAAIASERQKRKNPRS